VAAWRDVARIAEALPEVTVAEAGHEWRVKDKLFVWERPLRRSDLEALGDQAPQGAILGAMVPDLGAKDALLADDPEVYFTTPHFNGYKAILVRLGRIKTGELRELVTEAWLCRAPKRLAATYLKERP
jgi:hypothetical protein